MKDETWNGKHYPTDTGPTPKNPKRGNSAGVGLTTEAFENAHALKALFEERLGAKVALGYVVGLAVQEKLERERALSKSRRVEPTEYGKITPKSDPVWPDRTRPGFDEEA